MKTNLDEFISKFSFSRSSDESEVDFVPEQITNYIEPIKPPSSAGSIIAENTIIRGSISTSSNIDIAGVIEGDVTTEGDVIISGHVFGDITCTNIKLRGCKVKGNIMSSLSVNQNKDSVITGDISAVKLDLAGEIHGNIMAAEGIVLQNTASIVGDIEARSISVFEGAAVNGKVQVGIK